MLHGGGSVPGKGGQKAGGRYAHVMRSSLAAFIQPIQERDDNPLDLLPELEVSRGMLAIALSVLDAKVRDEGRQPADVGVVPAGSGENVELRSGYTGNGFDNYAYQDHDGEPASGDLPGQAAGGSDDERRLSEENGESVSVDVNIGQGNLPVRVGERGGTTIQVTRINEAPPLALSSDVQGDPQSSGSVARETGVDTPLLVEGGEGTPTGRKTGWWTGLTYAERKAYRRKLVEGEPDPLEADLVPFEWPAGLKDVPAELTPTPRSLLKAAREQSLEKCVEAVVYHAGKVSETAATIQRMRNDAALTRQEVMYLQEQIMRVFVDYIPEKKVRDKAFKQLYELMGKPRAVRVAEAGEREE